LQLRETLTQEAQQLNTLTTLLTNIQQETQEQDRLSWRWHSSGQYTVRSCYRALQEGLHIVSPLAKIWTLKLPTRVAIFTWIMIQNKLLTVDNLIRRG
jgi:zinc-binding in reverse transcriptase